jgi:phosphoribosyl 1,2-cyclic phosphodiesterase
MSITFWGVRGSIACPGRSTVRYGGNTPCIEVRGRDRLIILDAGTGLYALGDRLMDGDDALDIDILLTHFHLDHVSGLPFFAPFFNAGHAIRIWAGTPTSTLSKLLHTLVSPPLFPIAPSSFKAKVTCHGFTPGEPIGIGGGLEVHTALLDHPDGAVGYRLNIGEAAVAYITDTEIRGDPIDKKIVALARATDLLIVDCTNTQDEVATRQSRGHSTWFDGIRLANAADARTLCLFHHDPTHDDDAMDAIGACAQEARPGSIVAREGMTIDL